jgi:predicted ATPase/signal transduction histidine kinase/CheY-like chemotaxis protein
MDEGAYQITSVLRESPRTLAQRGIRRSDGREVVIKTAAAHVAPSESLPRYRNEWFVTRMFETPRVPRVLELIESTNETALVFESNPGLIALDEWAVAMALPSTDDLASRSRAPLSVRQSLVVALGIVDALAEVHAKSVVHKDVKPSNLLVDPELGRVMLIDFGIATVVPRTLGRSQLEARFEGTLGYLPPEQTGRVNRAIDYRSDYYGLGACLYWMLSGAPPFAELHDHNELIHALLTRPPTRLTELRPELPRVLAEIVAKLLAPSAEDRYQGSFGLRADLSRCLAALDQHGVIEDFELATLDPSERLRQPRRLHGRERERARLLAVHRRAITEGLGVVLVRGPSGSGKSALVNELREAVGEQSTVFARCKFDQYTQASPHEGVGRILGSLLAQLARGSMITPERLSARVREALGPNGALLRDIVPEIEVLLGAQLEVVRVGPGDARDRFWDTLERFADALLIPTFDFVLFVDDVQWADAASLRLIESLCLARQRPSAGGPSGSLTIVLAARDEVLVEPTHPLTRTRASLEQRGVIDDDIELRPLALDDVIALVDDVLDSSGALDSPDSPDSPDIRHGVQMLARLLHRRTGGAPLYVAQLLMAYYAEGIIDIDRTRGRWRVDVERASRRESSGAVVEFLVEQFAALPQRSRRVLGVAACIGARFDLETLAAAADEPIASIGSLVWDAVATGHLLPVDSSPRGPAMNTISASSSSPVEYGFVHDRIQEVALADLPDEHGQLYLTLARRLLARAPTSGEQIHALASYVARAIEHVCDLAERSRFAQLCADAGARAKQAAQFETAARHYANALRLSANAAFGLTLELAECRFMAGDASGAEQDFQRARELSTTDLEFAQLLLTQVALAMVPGDTERALGLVMEAAARFQLDLRRAGSQAWIFELMGTVIAEIEAADVASIPTRPALEDPQHDAIARLLLHSTDAAYFAGDIHLYAALGLIIIRLGLVHGINAVVGVAFVELAIVIASTIRDYEATRRYSQVGFAILERFPEPGLVGMCGVIKGSTIQPWIEPMAASLAVLRSAHTQLRASGMRTKAGYASFCVVLNSFAIGRVLPWVVEDAHATGAYLDSIGDRPLLLATHAHLSACELLTGSTIPGAGWALTLDDADDADLNPASRFVVHALRAITCWMLDDRPGLSTAIESMGPSIAAGSGMFTWVVFEVITAAHACTSRSELDEAGRVELDAKIEQTLAMLTRWHASCPENAGPLLHLLAGEWARARGELERARDEYTAAADAAAANGMMHFEGIANERGAEVLLELGQSRYAVGYLDHARRSYARWGAHALERRVIERLRTLGHTHASAKLERGMMTPATDHSLDVTSIVKMSLALAEATHLDSVLAQLLAGASQNAGADRCAILLQRNHTLELQATQVVGAPMHRFEPALALDEASDQLASWVVRECMRSEAAVILDDARTDSHGRNDPYLRDAGIRSVLALPVVKRGERFGVLYFENRATPGAFARQHLGVLSSLAAQAAVSIDNARLFDALREREAQWRALVDSAPDSIMIVDHEHRVEFSNRPGFGRDSSVEPEPLVGVVLETIVAARERARVTEAIDYVFATGNYSSFEVTHETPAGRRQLMTRLGPILRDEAVDRVTLISTDVTEQRELELQFRQAQKLQAVGTLAGGIAHDFNNILTIIIGACELGVLSLERLGLPPDSLAGESFADIGEAADRATRLTRQLLAFSRKQVLQPKRFDLRELVRDVARMLTRLIGEDITLELDLSSEACGVHVDPGQMEQVIMNLAVNARDAMPRGGTLRISTTSRELAAGDAELPSKFEPGRYVALEVADTGTGIAPDVLQSIFEPFFTTKDAGKGTGLGLSTVLGIVEQSGGHVSVTSELGHGTRFRVSLPATVGEHERILARARATALPRGSETLLIVEDDPALARLTAQILQDLGYRVLTASGHDAALDVARELGVLDLLITDVVLAGPNGLAVAAAIEALYPAVKVIYTSGYTDDAVVRHGITTAFLQKPFTREALAVQIRQTLDEVE